MCCLFNGLKIKEDREFDNRKAQKKSKLQARTKLTTFQVLISEALISPLLELSGEQGQIHWSPFSDTFHVFVRF